MSIFNFHYAKPPNTVTGNYGLNRAIGDDETGFAGSEPKAYRLEGWDFILAGGAPDKATARALVEKGRTYAIYINGGSRTLESPKYEDDIALRILRSEA